MPSLQLYPSPIHPYILWLITMVTISNSSSSFVVWVVHLSWTQSWFCRTCSRPSLHKVNVSVKKWAEAVSTGTQMIQLHHRSCQSMLQGSRTKGRSHVARNFLEAIKTVLFNSFFITRAILTVKWSFSAQLPIQSWEMEMWKHFSEQCWTHLLISKAKREWRTRSFKWGSVKTLRQKNILFLLSHRRLCASYSTMFQ